MPMTDYGAMFLDDMNAANQQELLKKKPVARDDAAFQQSLMQQVRPIPSPPEMQAQMAGQQALTAGRQWGPAALAAKRATMYPGQMHGLSDDDIMGWSPPTMGRNQGMPRITTPNELFNRQAGLPEGQMGGSLSLGSFSPQEMDSMRQLYGKTGALPSLLPPPRDPRADMEAAMGRSTVGGPRWTAIAEQLEASKRNEAAMAMAAIEKDKLGLAKEALPSNILTNLWPLLQSAADPKSPFYAAAKAAGPAAMAYLKRAFTPTQTGGQDPSQAVAQPTVDQRLEETKALLDPWVREQIDAGVSSLGIPNLTPDPGLSFRNLRGAVAAANPFESSPASSTNALANMVNRALSKTDPSQYPEVADYIYGKLPPEWIPILEQQGGTTPAQKFLYEMLRRRTLMNSPKLRVAPEPRLSAPPPAAPYTGNPFSGGLGS